MVAGATPCAPCRHNTTASDMSQSQGCQVVARELSPMITSFSMQFGVQDIRCIMSFTISEQERKHRLCQGCAQNYDEETLTCEWSKNVGGVGRTVNEAFSQLWEISLCYIARCWHRRKAEIPRCSSSYAATHEEGCEDADACTLCKRT